MLTGICSLLVYIPFLNKPFHIDDPFFLYAARAIDLSPLHPFAASGFYDLWKDNFNSIAFYYFPAAARALLGENEILMHSAYFIFFAAAVYYFRLACVNAGIKSAAPTLLFLASPLTLLTGTSIMSDLPLVAFLLASFYHLASFAENGRPGDLAVSLAAFAAAALTKYYAVVFIPLYFAAFALYGRRNALKYAALAALALAAAFAVYAFFRQPHILYVLGKLGWIHSPVRKETLSFLTTLGGISVFPLCFLLLLGRDTVKPAIYAAVLPAAFILSITAGLNAAQAAAMSLYSANSVFIFYVVWKRFRRSVAEKNRAATLMTLWFFAYSLFLMLFPNIMAGRYVLPLLPPLIICLYLELRDLPGTPKHASAFFVLSTLALGLALNTADYKLAGIYRDFGKEASGRIPAEQTGYLGHYAFDYYMQKNGFERFDIKKHKYLIMSKYASAHVVYGGGAALERIKKEYALASIIPKGEKYPLRVWDPTAFAGFHLNMFGYLPWGISSDPMETFYVFARK